MMNTVSKNKNACDVICRNHTARADRDVYRICPSKITKRELEDLYFALLENNVELKKGIHAEQDKVKVLSTKVQRMSAAQKNAVFKDKEYGSMVVINEQKESISDLKKANDRMADRIRLLNMRLCSAKQFLKRSPTQTSKCPRCVTVLPNFRNSSISAFNIRPSDVSVKTTAISYQHTKKDVSPTTSRNIETQTELEIDTEKQCNENKCSTQMDELKEKVFNLQEELKNTHTEYSKRITTFENNLRELHEDNLRLKSANVAREHEMVTRNKILKELKDKLRESEAKYNDTQLQLTIEKRKLVELETSLRLATASNEMAKTIEKLTSDAVTNSKQESHNIATPGNSSICSRCLGKLDASNIPKAEQLSPSSKRSQTKDSTVIDKESSENENNQTMLRLNQEMLKKISELQAQLDLLRIKNAGETVDKKHEHNHAETMGTSFKVQTNKENSSKEFNADSSDERDKRDNVKSLIAEPISTLTLIKRNTNKVTKTRSNSKEKNTGVEDKSVKISRNVNDNDIEAVKSDNDITSSISETNIKSEKNNAKLKIDDKSTIAESTVAMKTEGVNQKSSKNTSVLDSQTADPKTDEPQSKLEDNLATGNSSEIPLKRMSSKAAEGDKKSNASSEVNKIEESKALIVSDGDQKQAKQASQRRDSATYTKSKNADTYTKPNKHKDTSLSNDVTGPNTYTLERVTSPENTDHEISSLSDLPAEKYVKYPRDVLSPGEHKSTVEQSDTEISHTDYGSLSEGELPDTSRVRRLSSGERPSSHQISRKSSIQMEETLQAISQELQRCTKLLHTSRREFVYYSKIT